jgi:arylsulfatase A-like enzyme
LKVLARTFPAWSYHWGLISARLYYAPASEVRSRGISILDDADRPLFLYLHLMDLHGPYLPPKRHLPASYEPAEFVSYFDLLARLVSGALQPDLSDPGVRNARQRYEGELRFADEEIGRLVEILRARGRWDDTLVWILSDHGEAFGEHDWVGHSGNNVFSTLLHVPLILKPPSSAGLAPRRVEEPASTFDLLPTTLAMLGIEPSGPLFGEDLLASVGEAAPPARSIYSDSFHPDGRLVSCIQGPWQIQVLVPRGSWNPEVRALYHLERDPGSRRNELDREPAVVARLLEAVRERIAEEKRLTVAGEAPEKDAEMLERLRSLGYVDGDSPRSSNPRSSGPQTSETSIP